MKTRVALMMLAALTLAAGQALAVPVNVESINGPQDNLNVQGRADELGVQPFPTDELITAEWWSTDETACFEPGSDDPAQSNVVIEIQNLTGKHFPEVYYVAEVKPAGAAFEPLTNHDGWIGNAGRNDATRAFRIDSVGINKPLIFESGTIPDELEPFEIWQFIVQDYHGTGVPSLLNSIGIAGNSAPQLQFASTGSIIAVPEPATMVMLTLGAAGILARRRRR